MRKQMKTPSKTRRYKVGGYKAWKEGNEIVVGYLVRENTEDGKSYWAEESRFDAGGIEKIKGLIGENSTPSKLTGLIAQKKSQMTELMKLYEQIKAERRTAENELYWGERVKGHRVTSDADSITIGCTTIPRRTFEKLARLLS